MLNNMIEKQEHKVKISNLYTEDNYEINKKELEFIIDKTYENLNKENNYKNFKIEFSKKNQQK